MSTVVTVALTVPLTFDTTVTMLMRLLMMCKRPVKILIYGLFRQPQCASSGRLKVMLETTGTKIKAVVFW